MTRTILALCLALGMASAQEAKPGDLASLLPAKTLLMVEVDDLGGFQAWTRETALGRIWMEPEVQQFAAQVIRTVHAAMDDNGGFFAMVGLQPDDFRGIEIRRGGLAVVDFAMEGRRPWIDAAVTFQVRKGQEKVARIVESVRQGLVNFLGVPFVESEVRGRKVWGVSHLGHEFLFTMKGDRFVLTSNRARLEQVLGALDEGNATPLRAAPRYANAMKRMGAERSAMTLYADVRAIHDKAVAIALRHERPRHVERFERIWKVLGMDAAEAFVVADIPQGTGFRTEMALTHTATPARGIFKVFTHGPVNHRFARFAPAHCLLYGAERWDAMPSLQAIVDMYAAAEPRGRERVRRFLERFKATLGADLKADVLESLGTDFAGYLGKPPGGGLVPDIVWFGSLKDKARLEAALDTIARSAVGIAAESGMHAKLRETHFRGLRIRYVELAQRRGDPIPVAPAWAFGDDYVAFALWPHAIRNAHIEKPSLAGSAEFRALVRAVPPSAASATWLNSKDLVAWLYNTATPVLQVLQGAANRELEPFGVSLKFGDLPAVEVITRHLGGTMFYTAPEEGCVRMGFVSPFGSLGGVVALAATAGVVGTLVAKGHEQERADAHGQMEIARLRAQLEAERARYGKRIAEIERELAELRKLLREMERR